MPRIQAQDVRAALPGRVREVYANMGVELSARGGEWSLVRCCFHQDRQPSLSVNLEHGGWRCFGACDARGDVFAFFIRKYNTDFPTSVQTLGGWLGLMPADNASRDQAGGSLVASTSLMGRGEREPEQLTDLGNAERFVRLNCGRVIHVTGQGWFVYDGRRWVPDVQAKQVGRLAIAVVRDLYAQAAASTADLDRGSLGKWARQSETESRLRAMVKLAMTLPGIDRNVSDLDRHPMKLNLMDGTLNLEIPAFPDQHDPEDLMTKVVPVTSDVVYATCPRWEQFLREITNDNGELITFLQRAVGYALTGSTAEQCLFILWGRGSNGKSTFLKILGALFGDYGTTMNFSTLTERRQGGASEDIARLRGMRLVTAIETNRGQRFNESVLKTLTGGDEIAARHLYQSTITFTPTFKLFLAVNDRPTIAGTDHAIWRRIRLIPFTAQFSNDPAAQTQGARPAANKDELEAALLAELPGILKWACQGCFEYQRLGLGSPPDVQAAVAEYRREMDDVTGFLGARCVQDQGASVPATELYVAYTEWCELTDREPRSQSAFGRRLTEAGYEVRKRRGNRVRLHLQLRPAQSERGEGGELGEGFLESSPTEPFQDIDRRDCLQTVYHPPE